jgi:PAS domain S-box-containing protein
LYGTLTPKTTAALSGGHTLAVIAIQVEQDLVTLRRRLRAVADDHGLEPRAVRGLSAAVYDAARLLLLHGGAVATEIRLVEAPALQVTLRTPTDGLRPAVDPQLDALRPLVDALEVDDAAGFCVSLSMELPPLHTARRDRRGHDAAAMPGDAQAHASSDIAAENDALRQQIQELQAELQETNRGVVALYAELDDQTQRLRQAEDRLRVLLDSVQDYAICMLDREGEIVSWNSGAERLFGYAADEITGRRFSCFYTVAEREDDVAAAHLAAALADGRFECEGLRVRRGGSAFDAHVLIMPMRGPDGALRGYSLVVRDVTERKRLEDDLRRRAEELAAANRAKEDFLATLSHELRTPLNAMLGWTRLLRMGKLEPAAMARALETIERNAHIQEQLIADILDVSRIVTGKLRLSLRPIGRRTRC